MRKRVMVGVALVAVAVVFALVIVTWNGEEPTNGVEPHRWVLIEDENGDRMAVETNETKVWNQLVEMNQTGTINYVGGMIEEYENEWGFHLVPKGIQIYSLDKMVIGETTIREISEDLDTYLEQQFPIAYVEARVVEIHES